VAAGALTQDFTKAIFGYIGAMILGLTTLLILAIIPVLNGSVTPPGDEFLVTLWLSILVQQTFPILILLLFAGSVIGAGLAEHYWY
jgi:hypothetical protein